MVGLKTKEKKAKCVSAGIDINKVNANDINVSQTTLLDIVSKITAT